MKPHRRRRLRRQLAITGLAALGVPLSVALIAAPTAPEGPGQGSGIPGDRLAVQASLGGVSFDFGRNSRTWLDEFSGLRPDAVGQQSSGATAGSRPSGGDVADAASADATVPAPEVPETTGAVSPRAAPSETPAVRPERLILPPVPEREGRPQRIIEGRRTITIVHVPEPGATVTAAEPGEAIASTAVPTQTTAAAATIGNDASDTATTSGTSDEASPHPTASASAMGGLAPAPWIRITASVSGPSAASPAPAPVRPQANATPTGGGEPRRAASTSRTAVSTPMLGYAPTTQAIEAPFAAVLGGPTSADPIAPKLPAKMHSWAYADLPSSVQDPKEQKCLAEGVYFESRGESERGQAAVAQVILNRVRNPAYPDTICGVVYQQENDRDRCQFSFACDGNPETVRDPVAWSRAVKIAREVTDGRTYLTEIGDSTHYHADWVAPNWRRKMTRLSKVGVHIFYRTVHGGWM